MRDDFDLIIHKIPGNADIKIVGVADVHLGAREHMRKEWERFCESILAEPNTYIILAGDLINNGTKTSISNVYDEVMRPREQKQIMAQMLKPLRDRILCATGGNHERRSSRDVDDDPMYDIMSKLDLEDLYRENACFVKIQIGNVKGDGTKNPTYCLAVTHGAAGGQLTGSVVNRNERFAYNIEGVDLYVFAHSHKPVVTLPTRIVVDKHNNKVTKRTSSLIICKSWLDYGGYALQKMLIPAATNVSQWAILRGNRKGILTAMEW